MRLSGSDYSELLQTLLDAYDTDSFAKMLRIEFDKPLRHFASDKTPFPEIVAAVIEKSEQEDWTRELVLAAARSNPGNARLAQLAATWQNRPDDAAQAKPTSPPASGDSDRGAGPRRPWLLAALAVVLVAAGIGVWLWLNARTTAPEPAQPPTAALTAAAAAALAATDTPAPPEPTALPVPVIPPLPDFAPPLTTTVLLIDTPPCATQIAEMQAFLSENTAAVAPPVTVSAVAPDAGSTPTGADARALGADQGADLVIWCADAGDNGTELHFEALTQRASPEVFEPATITLPFAPFERSQRTALGIVNYLRRDYPGAEALLRSVVAMGPEAAPGPLLLTGNAQMFQRRYADAAATYNTVVKAAPDWAQAWNNLGVAELNNAWLSHEFAAAEAAFAEAIRLDPTDNLPYLGLGRIYRWTFDEVAGNAEKAFAACAQGEQADDPAVSTQGALCTSLTLMLTGWTADADAKLPPVTSSKTLEAAVSPYWAEPLALLGINENAYWMVNRDQLARQQASAYFARYLSNAYDDVLLEESRQLYSDVADAYAFLQTDASAP